MLAKCVSLIAEYNIKKVYIDGASSHNSLSLRLYIVTIQKWFVRVDVTEEFPFLVIPMQEYLTLNISKKGNREYELFVFIIV